MLEDYRETWTERKAPRKASCSRAGTRVPRSLSRQYYETKAGKGVSNYRGKEGKSFKCLDF